jgi:hypothetical protein
MKMKNSILFSELKDGTKQQKEEGNFCFVYVMYAVIEVLTRKNVNFENRVLLFLQNIYYICKACISNQFVFFFVVVDVLLLSK